MTTSPISSVASRVIDKCGGVDIVAALTGRTTGTVYKWTHAKEKGGTGGYIPVDAQNKLMASALRGEIDIGAEDFFDVTAPAAAQAPARKSGAEDAA